MSKFTRHELSLHEHIEFGTLDATIAKRIESDLDGDVPYANRLEFTTCLASLSSNYWDEVNRRTHIRIDNKGATLAKVLANAATPNRCAWYFNNTKFRHLIPSHALPLLSSGTSSNESLHHEVNSWFRNHNNFKKLLPTLEIALEANSLGKLLAHNVALYRPFIATEFQTTVLAVSSAKWTIPVEQWNNSCNAEDVNLPLDQKRQEQIELLKKYAKPRRIVGKKPAAAVVTSLKRPRKKVKRHVFNLKRMRLST